MHAGTVRAVRRTSSQGRPGTRPTGAPNDASVVIGTPIRGTAAAADMDASTRRCGPRQRRQRLDAGSSPSSTKNSAFTAGAIGAARLQLGRLARRATERAAAATSGCRLERAVQLEEEPASVGEAGRQEPADHRVDVQVARRPPTPASVWRAACDEQLGPAAEVVVDGARRHAGPAGDVGDRRTLEAALDAHRRRGRHQPLARALRPDSIDRGRPLGGLGSGSPRLSPCQRLRWTKSSTGRRFTGPNWPPASRSGSSRRSGRRRGSPSTSRTVRFGRQVDGREDSAEAERPGGDDQVSGLPGTAPTR